MDSSRVRFIFYLKKNIDINSLNIQPEEVVSVSFMDIPTMRELIKEGLMHSSHSILLDKVIEYKNNN